MVPSPHLFPTFNVEHFIYLEHFTICQNLFCTGFHLPFKILFLRIILIVFLFMLSQECLLLKKKLGFFWSCGMWDFSSLTRDQTHAPCIESTIRLPGKSHIK